MIVTSQDWKTKRKFAYARGYYHTRGSSLCSNGLEAPMEVVKREVEPISRRPRSWLA